MAESSQAGGAPTQAADEARAAEGAAQANTAGGPTDQGKSTSPSLTTQHLNERRHGYRPYD